MQPSTVFLAVCSEIDDERGSAAFDVRAPLTYQSAQYQLFHKLRAYSLQQQHYQQQLMLTRRQRGANFTKKPIRPQRAPRQSVPVLLVQKNIVLSEKGEHSHQWCLLCGGAI